MTFGKLNLFDFIHNVIYPNNKGWQNIAQLAMAGPLLLF